MIFKITRPIRSLNSALDWVCDYQDETRKRSARENAGEGLILGIDYHTSREPGAVTAHGYLAPRIERSCRVHQIPTKEAVKRFFRAYDAALRKRCRKILGLRGVFSVDPKVLPDAFRRHIDLEQLLIECVEKTAELMSKRYYSGESLGYLIGIHHDKDHLHGHLLMLPYTSADKRIRWSNVDFPFEKAQLNPESRENLMSAWSDTFREVVDLEIYDLLRKLALRPEPLPHEQKVENAHLSLMALRVGSTHKPEAPPTEEAHRKIVYAHLVAALSSSAAAICTYWEEEVVATLRTPGATNLPDFLSLMRRNLEASRAGIGEDHDRILEALRSGLPVGNSVPLQTGDRLLGPRQPRHSGSLEQAALLLRQSAERVEADVITHAACQLKGEMVMCRLTQKDPPTLRTILESAKRKEAPFYVPPPRPFADKDKQPGMDLE